MFAQHSVEIPESYTIQVVFTDMMKKVHFHNFAYFKEPCKSYFK